MHERHHGHHHHHGHHGHHHSCTCSECVPPAREHHGHHEHHHGHHEHGHHEHHRHENPHHGYEHPHGPECGCALCASRHGNPRARKPRFITEYTHAGSGRVMRASDYGYKAWPFGGRKGNPHESAALQAAEDALGREVEPEELDRAIAAYRGYSTGTLGRLLDSAEDHFERSGHRGVELADHIDAMRMALAARHHAGAGGPSRGRQGNPAFVPAGWEDHGRPVGPPPPRQGAFRMPPWVVRDRDGAIWGHRDTEAEARTLARHGDNDPHGNGPYTVRMERRGNPHTHLGYAPPAESRCIDCGRRSHPGATCSSSHEHGHHEPRMLPAHHGHHDAHVVRYGNPSHEEHEHGVECPMCGGAGGLLGTLGSREHYSCRQCGMEFSRHAPAAYDPSAPSTRRYPGPPAGMSPAAWVKSGKKRPKSRKPKTAGKRAGNPARKRHFPPTRAGQAQALIAAKRQQVKARAAGGPKSQKQEWIWYWTTGGYNSHHGTQAEAQAFADAMAKRTGLHVQKGSLHRGAPGELQSLGYMANPVKRGAKKTAAKKATARDKSVHPALRPLAKKTLGGKACYQPSCFPKPKPQHVALAGRAPLALPPRRR